MKYKLITKKNNLRKLAKLAKKLSKAESEYGYFSDQGFHASGLSFATLMAIHEYGAKGGDIPARKPFSIALFQGKDQLLKFTLKSLDKHVMSVNNKTFLPLEATLVTFGSYGVEMTKTLFGSSQLTPNKKPIRKKSGSTVSKPLIDYGELRDNMAYRTSSNREIKTNA